MITKKGTYFLVIILLFTLNDISTVFAEIDLELITNVDNNINEAFEKIITAEKEGAKVEELIGKLNSANIIYQKMIIELEKGNTIEANTLAQQCIQISSEVENDATILGMTSAEQTRILTQKFTTSRRIGAILVFLLGFVLWAPFEKYYKKRALKMRPVVKEDDP
ncbi:MAG: hypothetical protein ACXACP_00850 [Candidatus Hodarchaeales archaeon]|jgi:hypothetical protein